MYLRRSSSVGLTQTVLSSHVVKNDTSTEAGTQALESAFQGQILTLGIDDWVWIQILLLFTMGSLGWEVHCASVSLSESRHGDSMVHRGLL